MKKTYVKPEVYFENFELSANIATGCGRPLGHTKDACRDIFGGNADIVFGSSQDGCGWIPDTNDFCYHNPSDAQILFTS